MAEVEWLRNPMIRIERDPARIKRVVMVATESNDKN